MDNLADRLTSALAGRYRLGEQLGAGGMAIVFRAYDLKHERAVAVKVFRPELANVVGNERFLREIRLTARLDHPHILPLLDSGDAAGFLYYVMPHVEGETLRDRLVRERQLPLEEALAITREVADALSYAHSHGVVHRDIKPENILLAGEHARVADFGIARAVFAAGVESLTETGLAIGTPAYMSPEQAGGERDLDGRSDVYALGCVLYEMLAGHPPFTGGSAQEILARHSLDTVPRLSAARPSVPPEVEAAVATALAKAPADRFRTATLFAEALTVREQGAPPVPAEAGFARRRRRPWQAVMIGVGAIAVAALAVLIATFVAGPSVPPPSAYDRAAIAVLPLQNLSAQAEYAYFAGGLHDELLTQLSKVATLKVISRTSVMGYEGVRPTLRQIARELGVGSVVEGSVQVVGGRLRVSVQLIDAATDAHIWAERYDRTLDDAFAIQSEVAQQIVAAVGAALGTAERRALAQPPTVDPEAYRLYLQGRDYARRPGRVRQNLESARQLFEQAATIDPTFASARAALSQVYGWIHWYRYDASPVPIARQREEAEAALRLVPGLPEAHVAMGMTHYLGRRDYRQALDEFSAALEGLPNDAEVWALIGAIHRRLGNWREVDAAFERATQLDPRDAQLFYNLGGWTFHITRRYAEAVRAFNHALSLAPDLHQAAVRKGIAYVSWRGQLDTLRAILSRLPDDANVGGLGIGAAQHLQLLRWERQADSTLHVLMAAPVSVFDGYWFFEPNALHAAWAHQMRGDAPAARASFDSARVLLDSVIRERPDDWRVHAARGLALAGLGRRGEALREAGWLQRSAIYREDAFDGPWVAEDRARILAQLGEVEAALDEIERLLAIPSWLSVHTLRLDPRWDPIREHPRFRALLAKDGGG